jgi:hypothetical protein
MQQGYIRKSRTNNLICLPAMPISLTHALEGINYFGTQTKALLGSETITSLCVYCSTNYASTAIVTLQDTPREILHILERALLYLIIINQLTYDTGIFRDIFEIPLGSLNLFSFSYAYSRVTQRAMSQQNYFTTTGGYSFCMNGTLLIIEPTNREREK